MVIRLKNVQKIVKPDGRVYYYHRPTRTRIIEEYGTAAFIDRVNELNGKVEKNRDQIAKGNLLHLMSEYKRSPEFTRLAPVTKHDYLDVMDWLQPIAADMALIEVDTPFCVELRDRAFAKHKRRFANYVVSVLSILFAFGVLRGLMPSNPAKGVPRLRRGKHEKRLNRPWTSHEFNVVLQHATGGIKVAVALGGYLALREGDVLKLTESHYNGSEIDKNINKTGVPGWLPVCRTLKRIISNELKERTAHRNKARRKALKNEAVVSLHLVTNVYGLPFTESGFRSSFFKLLRHLKAEKLIGEGLTFHGLRHTTATVLAEDGADKATIRSITKHTDDASVETYVREASGKKLAKAAVIQIEKALSARRK